MREDRTGHPQRYSQRGKGKLTGTLGRLGDLSRVSPSRSLREALGLGPAPPCDLEPFLPMPRFAHLQNGSGDGWHLTALGEAGSKQGRACVVHVSMLTAVPVSGHHDNGELGLWTSPPSPLALVSLCLCPGFAVSPMVTGHLS